MKRIADYGIIGDGETAALVGRDGTIEWLCMPRFDSEACFAELLGDEANGGWRMAPADAGATVRRHYRGDTLILETIWTTPQGEAAVIDFMPMRGRAPDVIRIVEGRRGRVRMSSALAPRFDYGRIAPLVEHRGPREALAIAGPNALIVRTEADMTEQGGIFRSDFEVGEGDRIAFSMTWFPSFQQEPPPLHPPTDLANTERWWAKWSGRLRFDHPTRPLVVRSLLTLRALVHSPTGAMVAALTTSLPEMPGGARNWDYRFCWLRDATLTLLTLFHAGYEAEAQAWIDWLRRALAGEPVDVQPFYTITGRRHTPETEAGWLAGFNGAQPVRLGNGAVEQCQLDIYGEVLDALLAGRRRRAAHPHDDSLVRLLARKLEGLWQGADAGIWESRGEPSHHVYSKVMCWVAFDRAAQWFEHDGDLCGHYRALADEVKAQVIEHGFDQERGCFTAAYGDPTLDAATLRLPLVGFLPADDPRIVGTVAAIEQGLMRDGFVRRYETQATDDGVGGDEGAFLACSFWLADVYAMQGRQADAQALFDKLVGTVNDLGLLAEEVMPHDGSMAGNFPQALSHLSLVNTAMTLAGDSPRRRGRRKASG